MTKKYGNNLIRRLEHNHYAINETYKRLNEAIEPITTVNYGAQSVDDKKIYVTVGEMLLWVMNTSQWYLDHCEEYKDSDIIRGLRHAFNSFKHNMNVIEIHQKTGGMTFPFSFPIEIPEVEIIWTDLDKINEGYQNQKNNYKNFIEGEAVLGTFEQAISFLNNQKRKMLDKKELRF